MYICLRVSIAVTKHHDHSNWGGKGLHFHLHHPRKSVQEFKQGRNLEAGANAEAMERCCSLDCFHCLLSLLFNNQNNQPRDDPHPLRAETSTISHLLRKCPTGLPKA